MSTVTSRLICGRLLAVAAVAAAAVTAAATAAASPASAAAPQCDASVFANISGTRCLGLTAFGTNVTTREECEQSCCANSPGAGRPRLPRPLLSAQQHDGWLQAR